MFSNEDGEKTDRVDIFLLILTSFMAKLTD